MNEYIFFMHDDATAIDHEGWAAYFGKLRASGRFDGGSSIGNGICASKSAATKPTTSHLTGYIRVRAESVDGARQFLAGNPVYEAGGTIEIRELPHD